LEEFLEADYQGLIHIRNRIANGPTWYDVPSAEVDTAYHKLLDKGVLPNNLYFSGMAPTSKTLIQGEVIQSTEHITLFYSRHVSPMRESLRKGGQYAESIIALELLRYYLNPVSMDWLQFLLEAYPDHCIEFSCYSVNWGTLTRFNTVFWEVRYY